MAGLPALLVELDNGSGTFPFNITAYVDIQQGDIRTERGRQNEFDDIEAGEISLRMNNNDGRFTLGSATYGIVKDQRLRFTETVGVTVSRRFTGYVTDWPVRWTDAVGKQSFVTVTAVDRMARLARRDSYSLVQNDILADGPSAYYTLGEPAGSVQAGDTSGKGNAPLVPAGVGAEVVFGEEPGLVDGLTAGEFANGRYLTTNVTVAPPLTVEAFFLSSTVPVSGGAEIVSTSDASVYISTDGWLNVSGVGGIITVKPVADGATHHVAFTRTLAGATALYLDGVLLGTGSGGTNGTTFFNVGVNFTGTIAHAAVTPSALSATRVASHASAGLAPEVDSTDARISRYAAYAGVATSDQSLESGATRAIVAPTDSGKLLDAMQDTAKTEGGALFINGAGTLVFQSRYRRPLSVTTAAVFTIGLGDPDPDSLAISSDDQYLFNDVTGTRPDGAIQRSKNDASLAKYEQYPDSVTLNVTSDAEVLDRITWRANIYAEPLPRLSSVTIDLLTQSTAQQVAALGIEIGSKITISGLPAQSPFTTADLFVEGLNEAVGRDKWTLTLNTVSADLFRAWILEDATYGVLGTTTRLYY